MKGHIHSRIAKLLVVLALAVVASVMFVFVGCSSECEHANTHVESTATCTKDGVDKTICNDCGATIKTTEHKAEGHKWDEGKVVAATCAAGGYTLKTCTVCGTQQQVDLTEALPHAWKNTTTVEATCEKDGYTEQTCEACGATRRVNIVAAEGHKWVNKEVAATCGTAGRTYQECSVCHEIRNQVTIPATGEHNWEKGETVAATCETNGYTEYECSVCHATKQDDIKQATDHDYDYDNVLTQKPTCTQRGYYYTICRKCGTRENLDSIPATGHTYEWKVTKELTCTTDGTITGTCKDCDAKVSYTADQYAALDDQQKTALKISDAIYTANGGKDAFLQAEGHYYVSFKILNDATLNDVYHDAQHKYDTPTAGDKKDDPLYLNCQSIGTIKVDGKDVDYSDYSLVCLECNVKKDVEAHTPDVTPAHNCVAKAGTDGKIAWTCTLCGYDQPVEEHKVEMVEIATGETAPADAEYSCLYQYKCTVCNTITDAQGPHTQPGENDTYYKANCQHGELCMTCGKDIFGGKTEHKLVKMPYTATAAVNGQTAKDSTCTTKGLDVYYCEYCAGFEADEEYPFDVAWTTLSAKDAESLKLSDLTLEEDSYVETGLGNFFTAPKDLKAHAYETTYVSANPDDPDLKLCTSDFYKKDVCKDCGAVRKDSSTNADGLYGLTKGHDEHNFTIVYDKSHYLNADGTKKDGMSKYQLPNCSTNGWFLQECTNCLKTDNKTQCGTSTWVEVTLEQYSAAGQIEGVTSREEALAKPEWHVGEMPACGHPVCDVCETSKIHTAQYTLTFVVSGDETVPEGAELPQIEMFTGWSCYLEGEDWARFEAFMSEINKNNTLYNLAYYRTYNAENDTYSNQIADLNAWKAMLVPTSGTDTFREKATIYVVCSLAEMTEGQTTYFTLDGSSGAWMSDGDLHMGFQLDNTVIPYTSITSIKIEVLDDTSAVKAWAVSEGEKLAAYIDACEPYWPSYGAESDVYAYSFSGFQAKYIDDATVNPCWDVEQFDLTYNTVYSNYTMKVTIECGEDITFVGTGAMNFTQYVAA